MIYAKESYKTRVYGFVMEFGSNRKLCGAKIGMIARSEVGGRTSEQQIIVAETDPYGFFEIYLDGPQDYTLFAYYNDDSTPGIDYLPAYRIVSLREEPQYVNFSLLPGASVNLVGDPFFSPDENAFLLEVKDEGGLLETVSSTIEGRLLESLGSSIRVFETRFTLRDSRVVFAPSGVKVKIEVNVFRRVGMGIIRTANFTVPFDGYLNLSRGSQTTIDLKSQRLNIEAYISIPALIDEVRLLTEKIGVLSTYERSKLSDAERLLAEARAFIEQKNYVDAQANLYESYLLLTDARAALIDIFQNSASSTVFVTLLIGISSSAIGAIMFKDRFKRVLASSAAYILLASVLYYMYPGYVFIQDPAYSFLAKSIGSPITVLVILFSSFAVGFILVNAPYNYGERSDRRTLSIRSAIIAVFSIAAENLKRRRFRTLLVMTIVLVSVTAFISLTSISYESGFITDRIRKKAPSQGILLFQRSNNSETYPFGPIEPYILEWLGKSDKVRLMSVLLKNFPQVSPRAYVSPPPLGEIINPKLKLNYSVTGVIGLKPSLESELIGINRIVGEGDGRFLEDDDLDGVLISREASEHLNVKAGDRIVFCGINFTVIGIFDSAKLRDIIDLDGDPVLPKEVFAISLDGGLAYIPRYVASESTVIMVSEAASKLPLKIVAARVIVRTQRVEDMVPLARALALTFQRVETFVSLGDEIIHFYIGNRLVSYGFTESLMLLILASLNIGVTLLNSVYERRREIMTLSTIGLNPTQISAVFMAEALIIAFIAGSLGYLLGLVGYYIFFSLSLSSLVVKYKVEAIWGAFALLFSASSSMIGALLPSLKASIMATPSLLRKFVVPGESEKKDKWCLEIPIKIVNNEELLKFTDFMEARLREYGEPVYLEERVDGVVLEGERSVPESLSIKFHYKYGSDDVNTRNKLFAVKNEDGTYTINLSVESLLPHKRRNVWQTAAFIRRLALEYTETGKGGKEQQ